MTMTKAQFRAKYAKDLAKYEAAVASGDRIAIIYWEITIRNLLKKAGL